MKIYFKWFKLPSKKPWRGAKIELGGIFQPSPPLPSWNLIQITKIWNNPSPPFPFNQTLSYTFLFAVMIMSFPMFFRIFHYVFLWSKAMEILVLLTLTLLLPCVTQSANLKYVFNNLLFKSELYSSNHITISFIPKKGSIQWNLQSVIGCDCYLLITSW